MPSILRISAQRSLISVSRRFMKNIIAAVRGQTNFLKAVTYLNCIFALQNSTMPIFRKKFK